MARLRTPSPAMVVACLALILSLGGNAWAVTQGGQNGGPRRHKIRKGEIAKGAVTGAALAKGAVTAQSIRKGAVGAGAIAPGAIGASQLAPDAVTATAVAPSSIYAYALGPTTTAQAPIKDLDEGADLSTWTNSSTATATCPANDRVLSGSTTILNPGNRRVAPLVSVPVINGSQGWEGSITSDSGGLAEGAVIAVCLQAGP
jgi:hypothetical protein